MILSTKKRILYLANGRTGSSFIHKQSRKIMNDGELILTGTHKIDGAEYGMKHAALSTANLWMEQNLKSHINDAHKVYMFVRNPLTRMKSSFGLLSRISNRGIKKINELESEPWKQRCKKFFYTKPTIDEYIKSNILEYNCDHGKLTYLDDMDHSNVVYFKYENFAGACTELFQVFGYPSPNMELKINSSESFYRNLELKPETLQLIQDFFYQDMKRFGYLK